VKRHIPYFSFYPADFMNGVRGMSAQEVGVYMMLLCRIYEENGPVDFNPLRLSTYCGMRQATFENVVSKLLDLGKLEMVGGTITNRRAEAEISKRADDLKNSSKAGKASAKKRQEKQRGAATDVQQPFNHTDTDTDTYLPDANASGAEPPSDEDWNAWRDSLEAPSDPDPEDPVKTLFDAGIRILTSAGMTEQRARTFLGKLRKDHPGKDEAILAAIMNCRKAGAVDPVPWITASMSKPKTPSVAEIMARIPPLERTQ
jgi:uncharacterized protein YdaU (DUF1376 family)